MAKCSKANSILNNKKKEAKRKNQITIFQIEFQFPQCFPQNPSYKYTC